MAGDACRRRGLLVLLLAWLVPALSAWAAAAAATAASGSDTASSDSKLLCMAEMVSSIESRCAG